MKTIPLIPFKFTAHYILENLSNTGRTKKQILSFAIDAGIVAFSVWAAFSLRLGQPYSYLQNIWYLLLFLPPLTVLMFAGLGIYRWVVRASSSRQFEQLIKGAIASSAALLSLLYLFPVTYAPRSVFFIYGLILVTLTMGVRAVWARIHNTGIENNGKPVAIYGAGAAGRQLVSLMRLSNEYHPVIFLDDSYALIGSTLSGLNICNPKHPNITQVFKKHEIAEIIMAMPSIQGERYSKLLRSAEQFHVPIKTIPSITDIVSGKSSPDDIRTIKLEDLLGRAPVEPDQNLLIKNIKGKRVLITGAGGSIGSELCRQILSLEPASLVLLDNSEPSLYKVEQELIALKSNQTVNTVVITALGSITDDKRVSEIFNLYKPETVYHAAAYKHVPMVEAHPFEGVKTNVLGTRNLVLQAEKHRVETFVFISTDKAVRPTNVMGATKRIAELILQSKAAEPDQKTTYCMVRFGNVLGSSGSVIPLFKNQIAQGGPVTVTHPDMTRYFMTISEAVSLVIQAGSMAKGGEVFLLDMGNPVKIVDLAKAMIRLHGLKVLDRKRATYDPDLVSRDIEIIFTGIRPGEKLFEELLIDKNSSRATSHKKIKKGHEAFSRYAVLEKNCLQQLIEAGKADDIISLEKLLSENVSGYQKKASFEIIHSN